VLWYYFYPPFWNILLTTHFIGESVVSGFSNGGALMGVHLWGSGWNLCLFSHRNPHIPRDYPVSSWCRMAWMSHKSSATQIDINRLVCCPVSKYTNQTYLPKDSMHFACLWVTKISWLVLTDLFCLKAHFFSPHCSDCADPCEMQRPCRRSWWKAHNLHW